MKLKDENSYIHDGVGPDGKPTGKKEYYCSQCPSESEGQKGKWTISHGDKHPTNEHQTNYKEEQHTKS